MESAKSIPIIPKTIVAVVVNASTKFGEMTFWPVSVIEYVEVQG